MTVIQIRDVPDATAERLKRRAAGEGKSLSEYLRAELDRIAAQPTLAEMLERVSRRTPVGGRAAADILREERRARP